MGKRWSIHDIKKFVDNNSDAELLSTEFRGYSQRLQFRCACGNEFEKTFKRFKQNHQRKCDVCQPPKQSR